MGGWDCGRRKEGRDRFSPGKAQVVQFFPCLAPYDRVAGATLGQDRHKKNMNPSRPSSIEVRTYLGTREHNFCSSPTYSSSCRGPWASGLIQRRRCSGKHREHTLHLEHGDGAYLLPPGSVGGQTVCSSFLLDALHAPGHILPSATIVLYRANTR